MRDGSESFRPLSGTYISQLAMLTMQLQVLSFRPLSGTYISQYKWYTYTFEFAFPSPVGDLYFSIRVSDFMNKKVWGFPSPVGDLYFSIVRYKLWQYLVCFRPLSGTYISQYSTRKEKRYDYIVSVPCRGLIFLNKFKSH